MKFKEFIDKALFYVSVPKCAACGERLLVSDKALCDACSAKYRDFLKFNCSRCAKPYYECECTNKFLKAHYVNKVYKVFRYFPGDEPPSNMLIYRLKRNNRRDIRAFLCDELFASLMNKRIKLDNTVITSVPRRRASVRKYGFDHAEKLARALAKKLGLRYCKLLKSLAKHDQKKSGDKDSRLANANFDYKRRAPDITGKNVIIVDDIITTGASIGVCATLLHGLGAKKIYALALSVAYRDEYTPINK